MKYSEIVRAIREENKEPDWGFIGIDFDDDGSCDTGGGSVEWPTGEPASAVCVEGCHTRLVNVWHEHQRANRPSSKHQKTAKERAYRSTLYSHECPYCGDPCDDYETSMAGQEMECVCGAKYMVMKGASKK